MRIVIVGAGIIGSALAYALRARDVTLIEAGTGATGASFGWINASFHADADHFRLRAEAMAAWRRLELDLPLRWTGCLCWEETGAALDAQREVLVALGYGVEEIDARAFAALEPAVADPPVRALRFTGEGAVEAEAASAALRRAAMAEGARLVSGVRALGIETRGGTVTGLRTDQGIIAADQVIVAAGTGSESLLADAGVPLPMRHAPGLLVRTAAVEARLSQILVAPEQELRQDAAGHIWAPAAASHQGDDGSGLSAPPDALADATLTRLRALLPGVALEWDRLMRADRPVPQDGLPVIGACGPEGLFAAVMHSGVTLAPLVAEVLAGLVTDQGLSNAQADLIAPYTPGRFSGAA